MTIGPVVICPCTPLLVPQISGPKSGLFRLQRLCADAVAWMINEDVGHVIVLGPPTTGEEWDAQTGGTFAGYGVDLRAGGPRDGLTGEYVLGAWLLDTAGWTGTRTYTGGPVAAHGRTAMLVMADGSAKRTRTAPGYFDSRAYQFDKSIALGLREGSSHVLAAIDPRLASDLRSNAARPLHELARISSQRSIQASLLYDDAPLGVGYWLATWTLGHG